MTICAWCNTAFPHSGRRRFCSDACKQANWRARHADPTPEATRPSRPDRTIYECPACEQRYLGIRRCDDCQLFCRRVGTGGHCPHCDEPVTHADLDP